MDLKRVCMAQPAATVAAAAAAATQQQQWIRSTQAAG
jgi:hypothetical protein